MNPTSAVSPDMSVSAVLQTEDLRRRVARPPDHAAEARRLAAVVREIANSPMAILQRTVAEALLFCGAHSAGISLLAQDEDEEVFSGAAIVGPWAPYVHTRAPRRFSPYGVVLELNSPQLFRWPERYYAYLAEVEPAAVEALLAPFQAGERGVGVVWVLLHDESRQFDAEDERRLCNLTRCASAAYQVALTLDALRNVGEPAPRLALDLDRLRHALHALEAAPASCHRWPHPRTLSRRERQVCALVAQGHTNKSVASVMGLSEKTVATYRARAVDKIGFRDRADLVRFALEERWLDDA